MKETTTVLIVGAGPTGLMMAAQLGRLGVSYRIIDKNEDHTTQSRALVVQARSLEIFGQLGIDKEAIMAGEKAEAVGVIIKGRRIFRMDIGNIGAGLTRYPYLLMLEQSKTEAILNNVLAEQGQSVERRTELLNFTDDGAVVHARVRHANDTEEVIQARWLIGADGVHSQVRETLKIPFSGNTYQQSLFVLDCEISFPLPHNEMYVVFSDNAFTGLFPLTNGRVRVLGTVPEAVLNREHIEFEDIAKDFAARMEMDVRLYNPGWISVYQAHHRAVSTFRKGRCFLAGDAAHIHSPVGAQGMNTGLQDAYNLAWKLAFVSQGKAKENLLDTYNDERIGIAHDLVRTTDRAFYYVNSKNPIIRVIRLRVLPVVAPLVVPLIQRQKFIREVGFKTISEIAIHYRKSLLSRESPDTQLPRHAPHPGEGVPYLSQHTANDLQAKIDGKSLCLFLFTGSEQAKVIDLFVNAIRDLYQPITIYQILYSPSTATLYQQFGMSKGGYYLVRPDWYIAYRSVSFDPAPLLGYLEQFFLKSS